MPEQVSGRRELGLRLRATEAGLGVDEVIRGGYLLRQSDNDLFAPNVPFAAVPRPLALAEIVSAVE